MEKSTASGAFPLTPSKSTARTGPLSLGSQDIELPVNAVILSHSL